jgi:glycosyltransferase involved in cell wall biosynthesis
MNLSVVIPAYGNQRQLSMTLATLEPQQANFDECIVVDDGSDPPLIVPDWVTLHRVEREPEHRGAAFARNRCWSLARGDYVLSLDSSMLLLWDTVISLRRHYERLAPDIPLLALTTYSMSLNKTLEIWSCEEVEALYDDVERDDHPWLAAGAAHRVYDHDCSLMSRNTYDTVGGYDEQHFIHWGCENQDFDLRLVRAGGTMCSLIPRVATGKKLAAFHNWHEGPGRDLARRDAEFASKWGEPFSADLMKREVEAASKRAGAAHEGP